MASSVHVRLFHDMSTFGPDITKYMYQPIQDMYTYQDKHS